MRRFFCLVLMISILSVPVFYPRSIAHSGVAHAMVGSAQIGGVSVSPNNISHRGSSATITVEIAITSGISGGMLNVDLTYINDSGISTETNLFGTVFKQKLPRTYW